MATLVSMGIRLAGAACLFSFAIGTMTLEAAEMPPWAYRFAAREAGVPATVLFAVASQESGVILRGQRVPWPWTLNIAGEAHRFPTSAAACASLRRALLEVPPTRIDAGLGQLNVGYQSHRYNDPCELLDPYRNLAIAATILHEHHIPGEDWLLAIGRYHRPAGGEPAARYRRSVLRYLVRVDEVPVPITASRSQRP